MQLGAKIPYNSMSCALASYAFLLLFIIEKHLFFCRSQLSYPSGAAAPMMSGSTGNTTTTTNTITTTMPTAPNDSSDPLLLLPLLFLPVQENESDPRHCHLPAMVDRGDNASPRGNDSLTLETASALMDPSYHHHHHGNGGYNSVNGGGERQG